MVCRLRSSALTFAWLRACPALAGVPCDRSDTPGIQPHLPGQMLQSQIMQQGFQILLSKAQGGLFFGSQQASCRIEDKTASIIGRQGPYLVCLVQLMQHRSRMRMPRCGSCPEVKKIKHASPLPSPGYPFCGVLRVLVFQALTDKAFRREHEQNVFVSFVFLVFRVL